jgi:hypothetical protein
MSISACAHDSIESPTTIDMLLRSGNTTKLPRTLPNVRDKREIEDGCHYPEVEMTSGVSQFLCTIVTKLQRVEQLAWTYVRIDP